MLENVLIVDDTRNRAALTRINDITAKVNLIFGADISVQLGYLFTQVELKAGLTKYEFPLLDANIDKSVFPQSVGVNYNDVFIGVQRQIAVDSRASLDSFLLEFQTYYNKLVFTAANTVNPAHIQALWNAWWQYKVGNKTYVQRMSTRKDLRQPVTQQSGANNWPSYDGEDFQKQDPYIAISGKTTPYLTFEIGEAGFNGGGTGGFFNVWSVQYWGWTLQNGSGFLRFYTGSEDIEVYYQQYVELNKGRTKDFETLPKLDKYGNL